MDIWKQRNEAFSVYGSEFAKVSNTMDYKSLDEKTRLIGALMKLEIDIYNGGFIQFYCNWGYVACELAIKGLKKIKATTAEKLIQEAFNIVEKYDDDEIINELWDIADALSSDEFERLSQIGMEYAEDIDDIARKMLDCFSND